MATVFNVFIPIIFNLKILPQAAPVSIIRNHPIVESNGPLPDYILFALSAPFDPTDYSLAFWNNFFPSFQNLTLS